MGPQINSGRTDYCPIVKDGYLYFASERGFADDPLPAAVTTQQWLSMLASPGNGLGDIFRIRLSDIEAMRR